jgi:hypothetical protein
VAAVRAAAVAVAAALADAADVAVAAGAVAPADQAADAVDAVKVEGEGLEKVGAVAAMVAAAPQESERAAISSKTSSRSIVSPRS